MKKLSIEENARRYDDAIERGRQIQDTPYTAHWDVMKEVAEHLLPELKESEDERIRKLLIEAVIQVLQDQYCSNRGVSKEKVISWLEKQCEQKPAWSEEDNALIENVCTALGGYALYERKVDNYEHADYLENAAKKLKSLRPQNRWKPSEEQMKALDFAADCIVPDEFCFKRKALKELYKDLKKLREE